MKTVAIYSLKGGVGKTSLAVNLAWAAATRSAHRTLLWDLDAQAASSFIIGGDEGLDGDAPGEARDIFARLGARPFLAQLDEAMAGPDERAAGAAPVSREVASPR